jgi:hypothetical protein
MLPNSPEAEEVLADITKAGKRAQKSQAVADKDFAERNFLFIKAYEMKVPIAHIARAAGIGDSAVRCVVKGRGK